MGFSRSEKISIFVPSGLFFLTVIFHIGIREWYQPDVRYEEGSYYRTGDIAVTSLKLQNYGHSDAEKIKVSAFFPETIVEITTSAPANPFSIESGGKDHKDICGSIERFVRGQSPFYIYFAIKNPVGPITETSKTFISEITYNGGIGKTGRPIPTTILLTIVIEAIIIISTVIMTVIMVVRVRTHKRLFYDKLREAISFGISAKRENQPENEFEAQVAERFGNLSFRKETVLKAAKSTYQSMTSSADPQKSEKTKSL